MQIDEMQHTVKILLVDDHVMIRSGLRELLRKEPDMEVVGEASNGREAVEMTKNLQPDVIVMDLRMPDLNGIEATRQALAAKPDIKVIGLSALPDDRAMGEMVRAGAVGYVTKEAAFEELATAIHAVVNGKVSFGPGAISNVLSHAQAAGNGGGGVNGGASAFVALSPRERETLQLIAEGKSTKEVASILKVSIKTAETHRRNIMGKLNIDSVAELTKYAIREGLTSV